ncbi:hypothetical protein CW354_08295 [Marinicaulis flavus]|uniref:Uncharacterized protein n=1 Tax=Hyphococcus luteus TaxID=2058213 RepID=A0A2S7K738_9PROT|nr:hypothetical protein CW354_08295 [Marinicaulis flavus]
MILILILPVLGIGLRLMNEDKAPSKKAPVREIDLSVDVTELSFEETVAYINERCAGFTYWQTGSAASVKVTTLPVSLDRNGKLTLSTRYRAGGVESSSWFLLGDVAMSAHEFTDTVTSKQYTSIRFECQDDCIAYETSVASRAEPVQTTGRATLVCAYGDQVASALGHARRLLGDSSSALE